MATHSSILAWEIAWTEEPRGLRPWGHKRAGEDLETKQQQEDSVFKLGTYSLVVSPSDCSVR